MIEYLCAHYEAFRLGFHQRELRRREETAIARLGEKTLADGGARGGRLAALATEAPAVRARLEASRTAARRERETLELKLRQLHLTAGRLALALPTTGAEEEVHAIRAEQATAAREREWLCAERQRLAQDAWVGIRDWVVPRAPALVAMVIAWWLARSYADSHTATLMSGLGLNPSKRGPHLYSLTVDSLLVRYGLPLLAAALCAAVAQRVAARVRQAADAVQARTSRLARVPAGEQVPVREPARRPKDERQQRRAGKSR